MRYVGTDPFEQIGLGFLDFLGRCAVLAHEFPQRGRSSICFHYA